MDRRAPIINRCRVARHGEVQRAALAVDDRVDFRAAPAAADTDRLILLPPFPPAAERCALMWVESIICVSVERPRRDNSWNILSHIPRFAQCTKRL